MYRITRPYSQYKTKPNEVTLAVHVDSHGTPKATFEIGETVLKTLGWYAGDDYIDLYVDDSPDDPAANVVMLKPGTSYKVRAARGNSGKGVVVLPAAAINAEEWPSTRTTVNHEANFSALYLDIS
ncbi:MAG TPA: hypothetical protein VMW79_07945 [Anaerolineae bacterium]|nr:hypothetical protein [Anaerolineae bacterium]